MTVGEILSRIDALAPFASQEEWDNSGLLVGSAQDQVSGILVALDVTNPVIDEAYRCGASLIITHHPLMFSPRKTLTDADCEGRLISRLIRGHISLISAHTNLDRAPGGVNDTLAAACGLSCVTGDGFIRHGLLPSPVSVRELADSLARALSCTVRLCGQESKMVRQVSVSSGGGGEFWESAFQSGSQVFVTGEIHHHHALAAADAGLPVLECGHFATENPGIRALAQTLQKDPDVIQYNIGIYVSEIPPYAFPQQP